MKASRNLIEAVPRLRAVCFELDALAYLLRLKGKDDLPPLQVEEINYGTGRMLERLTNRVKRVMRDLEAAELATAADHARSQNAGPENHDR